MRDTAWPKVPGISRLHKSQAADPLSEFRQYCESCLQGGRATSGSTTDSGPGRTSQSSAAPRAIAFCLTCGWGCSPYKATDRSRPGGPTRQPTLPSRSTRSLHSLTSRTCPCALRG